MRPTGRSSSMHFMEMLPKGGLRQHCRRCRLSQAHPVLLLNNSVFILRDTGGLNDPVSRTCHHLSYAEWYNANQVSSFKHSNIRWRISDSFIPATFYSLLTARLTIRSVFVQSTLSWTIPQIERSCSWTCRVYSTTLSYGFPSHRRQKSECFCRIALHKL